MMGVNIIEQASKDFDPNNMTIFTGKANSCDVSELFFSNCCSQSGWGQDLNISNCSTNEQSLALQKKDNKCTSIGSFCSEREMLTGICLKTRYSYCCFDSQIANLIQREGKSQISASWGSPQSPICLGLSQEEISKINFDKIDFSPVIKSMSIDIDSEALSRISKDRVQEFFNRK